MNREPVITLNKENFIKGMREKFIIGELIGKYKLIYHEDFFDDYTLFVFSGGLVVEDENSSYKPSIISYDALCTTIDASYGRNEITLLVEKFIIDEMKLSDNDLEYAHFAMYINETEYMDLASVKEFIKYLADQLSTAKMITTMQIKHKK